MDEAPRVSTAITAHQFSTGYCAARMRSSEERTEPISRGTARKLWSIGTLPKSSPTVPETRVK